MENLFKDENGELQPLKKSEGAVPYGEPKETPRRCPGGAAPSPGDDSAPYVNPPHTGSSVSTSECTATKDGTGQ